MLILLRCFIDVFNLEFSLALSVVFFFFSSRRRHTRCTLVTGVQTCALPICVPVPPYTAALSLRQVVVARGALRVCVGRDKSPRHAAHEEEIVIPLGPWS